ncbi:ATP-binding protein [Occallatibacter savannae]|uniref:ATP-binding protein n=1 Tax=Occallatibacter savannae TaxID=1002691 RepID=UPI0013A5ABBD|nr:ATP-binding protein [Occallatibacter savannae]
MSGRIRDFDWAATPLGPIDSWPTTLRNTVEFLLSCGFPTTLQWGRDAVLLYNDAYIPVIGTRHPAALGHSIFETFPEIRETYEPLFQRVRAGETVVLEDLPYRYVRDNHPIDTWFNLSYSPVRDVDGSVQGVLAIGVETTARVALERTQELYRTLFENIDDGCMIIEQLPRRPDGLRDYRYILTNPASTAMFGLPNLAGKSVRDTFPQEDEEWYDHYDQVIKTGQPVRFERAASSVGMVIEMFLARIGEASDKRLLVLMRNITERRRAQEALRQSEKLAAVGRLASSIAHEINNPLEAVTNLVYLARAGAVSPETASLLDQADKELRRVSLITTETLRFHRQTSQRSLTDIAQLLDSILILHESRLDQARITTERKYRPHPEILCSPNEIRQVLANLITNAIEAMANLSSPRTLSIRLHAATDPRSGKPGIILVIGDTGSGMAPMAQARAFEPFFTTKEATNSGLGLWITREILDKHQGRLRFRSRQSSAYRGTIFTLFLPADPTS